MHRLLRDEGVGLASARILDLGLSRGLLLERFRRDPGTTLGGIEIDPSEIAAARKRELDPIRHFINVFEGNRIVARLPFDDDSADVVLAGEILEHMVDTESFLREVRRILRRSGAIVLSTPNILWWKPPPQAACWALSRRAGVPQPVRRRLRAREDLCARAPAHAARGYRFRRRPRDR